jgi:hypothetical protein
VARFAQPVSPQILASARPIFDQQPIRPASTAAGLTPASSRHFNPPGAGGPVFVAPGQAMRPLPPSNAPAGPGPTVFRPVEQPYGTGRPVLRDPPRVTTFVPSGPAVRGLAVPGPGSGSALVRPDAPNRSVLQGTPTVLYGVPPAGGQQRTAPNLLVQPPPVSHQPPAVMYPSQPVGPAARDARPPSSPQAASVFRPAPPPQVSAPAFQAPQFQAHQGMPQVARPVPVQQPAPSPPVRAAPTFHPLPQAHNAPPPPPPPRQSAPPQPRFDSPRRDR